MGQNPEAKKMENDETIIMSKKRYEILEYIRNEFYTKGYIPSLRDIGAVFSFKSSSTAKFHVDRLIAMGYLAKPSGSRAYRPGPLFGGTPEEKKAEEPDSDCEQFTVQDADSSALGVFPGDTVLYHRQDQANPNDFCVIRVGDKTLIRKLVIRNAHVWFVTGNDDDKAINGLDAVILGKPVRSQRIW